MSTRRLLGAHLPAASPERRETVAGKCLGCQTQFAIDVRLPLPATCPDCGADVLASADITLRFIVGRILRELIELAERDADAELVDALHDALDVAMPASSNGRGVSESRGPGPGLRRLGTFRRAERAGGSGPGP